MATYSPPLNTPRLHRAAAAAAAVAQNGEAETLRKPLPLVAFQEVHTTFVRGIIDKSYFGLRASEAMPASVLLTEEGARDSPFSSLALHEWTGVPSEGVGVYKLFSRYASTPPRVSRENHACTPCQRVLEDARALQGILGVHRGVGGGACGASLLGEKVSRLDSGRW